MRCGLRTIIAWAEAAAQVPGVHYLPREQFGEFEPLDFRDLTHLNKRGATKFTVALYDWTARQLTPKWREAVEKTLKGGGSGPIDDG